MCCSETFPFYVSAWINSGWYSFHNKNRCARAIIQATILRSGPIQTTLTCSNFSKFNVQIHFWTILRVAGSWASGHLLTQPLLTPVSTRNFDVWHLGWWNLGFICHINWSISNLSYILKYYLPILNLSDMVMSCIRQKTVATQFCWTIFCVMGMQSGVNSKAENLKLRWRWNVFLVWLLKFKQILECKKSAS